MHLLTENYLRNIKENSHILKKEIFWCLRLEQSEELLNLQGLTNIFKIQILSGLNIQMQ